MLRYSMDLIRPLLARQALLVAAATFLLTLILIPFETSILPLARKFDVTNRYINYPYVTNEHVPVWLLFLLAFVIPFGIVVGSGFLFGRYRKRAALSALAFVSSTVTTALVCDILKFLIGNQRPDFLHRCVPHQDAPTGTALSVREWCTSENWARTWEGCRSTPSGHSSISFNGLGFLVFWALDTFALLDPKVPIQLKLVGFSPLAVATLIALSRLVDHKHHWIDIILGAIIGTFVSYTAFQYVVKTAERRDSEPDANSEQVSV